MHQKLPSDVTSIQPHFHPGVSKVLLPEHHPCHLKPACYKSLLSTSHVLKPHGVITLGRPPGPQECTPGAYLAMGPTTSIINTAYRAEEVENYSEITRTVQAYLPQNIWNRNMFSDSRQEEDRENPLCLFLSLLCTQKSPRARGQAVGRICFESSPSFLSQTSSSLPGAFKLRDCLV